VESFEECTAKHARAIEEAQHHGSIPPTGETFQVGKGSRTGDMDRAHVEATPQVACPMGAR